MRALAACAPGMEPWVERELLELGLRPGSVEPGGVEFASDPAGILRANLGLGCALFVSLELGRFKARGFPELVRKASRLPWEQVAGPGARLWFQASSRRSKLYHTGAVEQRMLTAASERLGQSVEASKEDDAIRVRVRVLDDEVTVGVDTSEPPLRQRGYRTQVGKAPLREDLARGLLRWAGLPELRPEVIWDPFCGSATLLIEAGLLAAGRWPGAGRRLALDRFPAFRDLARPAPPVDEQAPPTLVGSDRDAGVIEQARANADRARVPIELGCAPLSAAMRTDWIGGRGLLICNPPFGERVSPGRNLRRLYARLGDVVRDLGPGWGVAMVARDLRLVGASQLELARAALLDHGGKKVHALVRRGV